MNHTPRTNKLPLIAIGVISLVIAAVAVGYFLPPPEQAKGPGNQAEATATKDTNAKDTNAHQPAGAWAAAKVTTFPLSKADIRDSQETPSIAIDHQGRIHLAWGSQTGESERTLFYSTSTDQGVTFSEPRAVRKSGIFKSVSRMNGKEVTRERRMSPHIAASGEKVVLAWSDAPPEGNSIQLLIAESNDGGQTFSEPVPVPQGENARPTFTGFSVNENGQVACSWLDSRDRSQQTYAAIRHAGSEQFATEQLIDAGQETKGVCPCCATTVKVAEDETVVVAYRGSVAGYRDIWISLKRPSDTQFSAPVCVVSPTWEFAGCPHDGPSLAIVGDTLHVAWMDARDGRQRAYRGWASLHDLKFQTEEVHASGLGTQGNTRLSVDREGNLHAVWEESLADEKPAIPSHEHQQPASSGAGRAILYAVAPQANGKLMKPRAIAQQAGKFQTRPAIAAGENGVLVAAWNELDETGKRLVIACQSANGADPAKTVQPKLASSAKQGE